MASSPWGDETVCEELVRLWKAGESFSQIAAQLSHDFGIDVSRNACIGKLHRMGMGETRPCDTKRTKERQPKPKRVYARRRQKWAPSPQDPAPQPEPYIDNQMADQDIPLAQRRSLMELTDATCRWPVGEPATPDFFFCGAMPAAGQPYCSTHCARAYSASSLRPVGVYRMRRFARA